jgi:putative transposase
MARLARLSIAGQPHHVLLRAASDNAAFRAADEYKQFLVWLAQQARGRLAIHAYLLLPNEVRLLATPQTDTALSRTLQALGRLYVRWFNRRHGRSGALWQGRFRSSVIEPVDVLDVIQHIESQPEYSGRVADAQHYPWSSLQHHLGRVLDPVITDPPAVWALGNTPFERQAVFRDRLQQPLAAARIQMIGAAVERGWVNGSPEFLDQLREATPRPLTPRARGRKKSIVSVSERQKL